MATRPDRPELIRLEVDRRLGHEWDSWDGTPLPRGGNFDAPVALFFQWSLGLIVLLALTAALLLFLLQPRLNQVHPTLPGAIAALVALGTGSALGWLGALALSARTKTSLLPERLAERGPLLFLMRRVGRLAGRFGHRDRVENAAVKLYDRLALARNRRVGGKELLLLIPRCLAKDVLEAVLRVARRYDVPVFVATRGQLARRAIRERRPRAVVAVACERDMVSGLADVAGQVPVLGLTLTLPDGPCRDTRVDLARLEEFVRAYLT